MKSLKRSKYETSSKMESEPDPMGIDNGLYAPPEPVEGGDYVPDFILPRRIVDPSNMTNGCQWGGLPISCDSVADLNEAETRISQAYLNENPNNSWG